MRISDDFGVELEGANFRINIASDITHTPLAGGRGELG